MIQDFIRRASDFLNKSDDASADFSERFFARFFVVALSVLFATICMVLFIILLHCFLGHPFLTILGLVLLAFTPALYFMYRKGN